MKKILNKLYQLQSLSELESYDLFSNFINGGISNIQLTSILIAIKMRSITPEEIVGIVKAFLKQCQTFPKPNYLYADIVGTGGDCKHTINISTISALVAAIANLKIVKHCNRNISSQSGSSDFLNHYKINLQLSSLQSRNMLDSHNICFLLATKYHTGFKQAMIVRKELSTTTLFNIIGPLLNPSSPPLIMIGVYHRTLLSIIAKSLQLLNYQRAIVIHSNGTDEATVHGITHIVEINDHKIQSYQLTAQHFGLNIKNNTSLNDIYFKNNYDNINNLLNGNGKLIHMQTIAINVSLLLKLFGYENLKENTEYALSIIKSGNILKFMKKISNNYQVRKS
ncbi:MAG: anthranilate phosphoribosyltransferase [Buchnera aphidicola (Eriosoma harunire)]